MAYKYLDEAILNGFDKYKYNAIDSSPFSKYVMHPFWNAVVQLFPRWVAPNVMTLTGFLLLVVNLGLLTYYDYDFYASSIVHIDFQPVPSWVWITSAFCLFFGHTLDGIDGKQARRTGSSTPLGELFDHGLDSLATLTLPLGMYSVFGRGHMSIPPFALYLLLWCIWGCFIASHWEKYNTGILFLPWGYDISLTGLAVMYVLTYAFGAQMWKFTLLGIDCAIYGQALLVFGSVFMSFPMTVWNIYMSYKNKTGKNRSFYEANRPLLPTILLAITMIIWCRMSPNRIIDYAPRIFFIATGIAFSNIACRLIVSQMSSVRCQAYNWFITPIFGIIGSLYFFKAAAKYEYHMLVVYTTLVTLAHLHYGVCVVKQMSDHFNIYTFSLQKRPSQKKE